MPGPRVSRLTVYPVKSLDGKSVEEASLTDVGALENDRIYALVDEDGAYVNGKAERRIHRIRSGFDLDTHRLCLRDVDAPAEEASTFVLPDESDDVARWFETYLGYDVSVRREPARGFPDDTDNPGPTLISTATIETLASWYDDVTPDGMRRRLRANVEISNVPAFWEDHLFADHGEVVRFTIGDVAFEGVNPCQRCVVPSRDPDTGEETPDFRERFIENRRRTKPDWTDSDRFDHDFRVMVNTRVPGSPSTIAVGDSVEIQGVQPEAERTREE